MPAELCAPPELERGRAAGGARAAADVTRAALDRTFASLRAKQALMGEFAIFRPAVQAAAEPGARPRRVRFVSYPQKNKPRASITSAKLAAAP